MQLSFLREELLKPLSCVVGVVERRQTLPILAYILLRHKDGRTTLTGTDLEIEITAEAKASAKTDGEMTIPARKLLDICRALPEGSAVSIVKEGEKVLVKAGKSRFTLLTLPPTDFPSIQAIQWDQTVKIAQRELKDLFEQTHFCMAQQDVRYYLNGLLIELSGHTMRVVATDGHRMAISETTLHSTVKPERQAIVPRKGVQEITRLLADIDEPVTVHLGVNHFCVQTDTLTFISKLIDGRYPDYNKVIPQAQATLMRLDRETFKEALSRAAILSSEKYRGVRLSVADKMIRITAHNPEQEEAQEEITADYGGQPVEIGFNVGYLIDAVSALKTKDIVFTLIDANSSSMLYPTEGKYPQYIIMPMRL